MVDDIGEWLTGLGLGGHVDAFVDNAVGRDLLPHLTNDDLKDLGIAKLGDRKTLLLAIARLEADQAEEPDDAVGSEPAGRGDAERRQLTVMFCDLVDSTGLSARLDPEDMRVVLRQYQGAVAREVARYEGHIAKFMGDGVLIYFGYPRAQEDAAERAVRAGLAIVEAIVDVATGFESLAARIGIATGQVVVGDLIGEGAAQEEAVTGQAPNLAARLQALARPGAIVVADSTHDLLGELFAFEALGEHGLKGFTEPTLAWRVTGAIAAHSRFEAAHGGRLTRLVGREQELELLKERWARARDGEGQVVLLTGEAGIGKSRLTRALIDQLAGRSHRRLRYQCSPHHANSALHPFIAQLEHAAAFDAGDDQATKLTKLKTLLRQDSMDADQPIPVIAALLSVPTADTRPELEPRRQKQRTLGTLLALYSGMAARQPVLMIFEDAHWADPTTLELLEQVVDRVQDQAILAVITGRPEFQPGWPGHSHITKLTLNRLGQRQRTEIVTDLTGGKDLPKVVLDQIVAKTDGVPLFVEELTKAVLESNLLKDAGERYELTGPLPSVAIPSTLQDSLMARLDRQSAAKEVAQIGAVIGREFSYELLAAVAPLPDHRLRDALDRLVDAELVFRRGTPPEASYIFKHALVQEVAYDTLLRAKRQELHLRVAAYVRDRLPNRVESEPEGLARHLTEAGRAAEALPYWHQAGQRASERSGYLEAVAHLTRGLEILATLPDSPERDRQELQLQITLGPALMATGSYSNPEMERTYLRARELARRENDPVMLFAATWGIWHNQTFLKVETGRRLTDELLALARRQPTDQGHLLQAHHAAWTTLCQRRSKISPPGRSKTSPLNVMRYAVLGGCPGSP